MIPNWLLGKSKSKLQEILGGGGGGTDYTAGDGIDISDGIISFDPTTTPVIDPSKVDGLDDDLAALAPKTALSNPNILHNPWFTVNQREVTSITVNDEYIADRWRVWSQAVFSATRNSSGFIVIDNSSGDQPVVLYQKRTTTYLTSLVGNKLTASVLLSDGTIYSGSITYDGSTKDYIDNEYISLYAPSSVTKQILGLSVKPGASVTIKALKLEVGEISTLHLDPRPEYALELAKCKRYFQRFKFNTGALIGIGFTQWSEGIRFILPYTEMRSATPQLVVTSSANKIGYTAAGSAAAVAISALSIAFVSYGLITLQATVSNLTPGTVYAMISMDTDTMYIDFNAEL